MEYRITKIKQGRKYDYEDSVLDRKTIGEDIDLTDFETLGEVVTYEMSQPEEVPERVVDADVIIVNKVPVNEQTIGTAQNLKLVCVAATGTNNLDKDYLDKRGIEWRNAAGYSTTIVAQHTFAMLFYLLEKLRYYDDYVKNGSYQKMMYLPGLASRLQSLPERHGASSDLERSEGR